MGKEQWKVWVREGRVAFVRAEEGLVKTVWEARAAGVTWEEIGAEWGMSKQGAYQWVQRRTRT